jgi:hypothetical protein
MQVRWLLSVALAGACAEPDPTYGQPGGIIGRSLPHEVGGGASPATVFGAPYDVKANRPTTTLQAAHAAKGGPTPSDALNCLECHKTGGVAAAKIFSFGGRVTSKGVPAPDVDVLVDQGEKLGPVKSDSGGFFWSLGAPVKAGAKAYVRKGDVQQAMGGALAAGTGGGCDSSGCHVPGKQGPINL